MLRESEGWKGLGPRGCECECVCCAGQPSALATHYCHSSRSLPLFAIIIFQHTRSTVYSRGVHYPKNNFCLFQKHLNSIKQTKQTNNFIHAHNPFQIQWQKQNAFPTTITCPAAPELKHTPNNTGASETHPQPREAADWLAQISREWGSSRERGPLRVGGETLGGRRAPAAAAAAVANKRERREKRATTRARGIYIHAVKDV